jgi:MFS-type transporter involved in bile tolerance (Atg22 family)
VAGLLAIANLGVIVGGTMDVTGFRRVAVITAALFAAAGVISALGIVNKRVATPASVDAARCLDRGR